jgi:hypothetical protein
VPLNISIDVDGTLLDENENVHPQTRKLIEQLKAEGHRIQLWSTGGADYALRRATEKGLADLFDSFGAKPDVAIDDIAESVRPVATITLEKDFQLVDAMKLFESTVKSCVESSFGISLKLVSHVAMIRTSFADIQESSRRQLEVRPLPIPFFGNVQQARVLTIGLNPSWTEFDVWRRWENIKTTEELTYRLVNYFRLANVCFPSSHKWFGEIEDAMSVLEFPWAIAGAHIDLCPWATITPKEIRKKPNSGELLNLFWPLIDQQMALWFPHSFALCRNTVKVVIILQSPRPSDLEQNRQSLTRKMIETALGNEWEGKIFIKTKDELLAWVQSDKSILRRLIDCQNIIG